MQIHLFLIDNDEDEMEIFSEAARGTRFDCRCSYAASAMTAFEVLPYLDVDFIFIDINMPVINGYECLALIKKKFPYLNARLVMYSTGLDKASEARSFKSGADICLRKTTTIAELSRSLSAMIMERQIN